MTDAFLPSSGEFPSPDLAIWRKLAEKTLTTGDFESRLVARTADGLPIEPLYTQTGARSAIQSAGHIGAAPFIRGGLRNAAAPWLMAQRIDLPDPSAANRQLLTDLENGASGLVLVLRAGGQSSSRGIAVDTVDELARVLDGVLLNLAAVTIEAGPATPRFVALLSAFLERNKIDPASLRLFPAIDPIGGALRTGSLVPADLVAQRYADAAHALLRRGFSGPLLMADGRPWSEAGATEAQELGYTLACAVAYLRWLDAGTIAPAEGAARIAFKITVDADQFMSIAKIRAMRLLWARVTDAIGIGARRAEVRVEAARRMLTARDPWVNLLRATVACFAGAVAGADEIALHPFTAALGVPDEFARRLARNTHTILAEESALGHVADPAGGSGYVESLTQALAGKAWAAFQATEAAGGLIAALEAGAPQAAVATAREKRTANVARRRIPITGVSEFPNIDEPPVPVLPEVSDDGASAGGARAWPEPGNGQWFDAMVAALRDGAAVHSLGSATVPTIAFSPLPIVRDAAPFEALRDAADADAAQHGARRRVFLANLGAPADTIARATFAKNVLEAGGLATLGNDGFESIAAAVEGFRASGTAIACLCSSDAIYETDGEQAARALKATGAATLLMAGNPGARRDVLVSAGVDDFLYAGMDVVAVLAALHERLGIAPMRRT
jgi:methylmalonyl-CoA mutase